MVGGIVGATVRHVVRLVSCIVLRFGIAVDLPFVENVVVLGSEVGRDLRCCRDANRWYARGARSGLARRPKMN